MKLSWLAALAVSAVPVLGACSDGSHQDNTDAAPTPCDPETMLTGEYIDWDSTTTQFLGVVGSTWTVMGDATRHATTAPNGRVIICIVPDADSTLTVTQASYLPALFVAHPQSFRSAGASFSARGLKTTRAPTFFTDLGLTYDDTKAQVLIEKQGAAVPLALAGATASFVSDGDDDTTWVAGASGYFVFFPNVPVGNGTAALTSTGSFVGPHELPLAAGTLTITSLR